MPFPYIDYACLAGDTNTGTLYPFAFSSGDAQGPGDEVVTVQRLLAGRYEFWGRIHGPAQPGDLKVILRNRDGKVVRSWDSPPNPTGAVLLDWHVVDIDGAKRSATAVGEAITGLFSTVRADSTYVCPAEGRTRWRRHQPTGGRHRGERNPPVVADVRLGQARE